MDMQENPFKNNYPVFKKHFTFHTIKNIFFFFALLTTFQNYLLGTKTLK